MWRSLMYTVPKTRLSKSSKVCNYSSEVSGNKDGGKGRFILSVIAAAGIGFTGAVVYGKYDSKFRKILEDNVPYINSIYKFTDDEKKIISSKKTSDIHQKRSKDSTVQSDDLLRQKLEHESVLIGVQKPSSNENKAKDSSTSDKVIDSNSKVLENKPIEQNLELEKQELEHAFIENQMLDLVAQLQKSSYDTVEAYEAALKSVKRHTQSLYDALDLPEGKDEDIIWKEVKKAYTNKTNSLKSAQGKAAQTRTLIETLKHNQKRIGDSKHPLVKSSENSISVVLEQIQKAEQEISSAENEDKTASDYQKLVSSSKDKFLRELQIVLPNYIHEDKDKNMTESDLNLLIAHAHRRIEQLQKQLAKQQITEKVKVDEAVRFQKLQNEEHIQYKIKEELAEKHIDLENAISERVASLKENFEIELRQQLRRQAAAHSDHIQEVLKVQENELERKFSLDLEEKLLHQKGVFISEISANMARLKGILAYLKAKSEFDKSTKRAQALWIACQALNYKLIADNAGNPHPLAKDIAVVKSAADEESEFVRTVIASIPSEAVSRGVYNSEVLQDRFQSVKKICRKVALIDDENNSLYRYILSYIQSFLIFDSVSISKEELEGKVAVDPSEWDVFSVLTRVSYCLQKNDLEQALRYANQLRGEPRVVARDWIQEVRLFLETQLAVKALLAHAAAVSVQAYH